MKIYNYLFCYAYELALRGRELRREAPWMFAIGVVCFNFGITILSFLTAIFKVFKLIYFSNGKYVFGGVILLFLSIYYLKGNRYLEIYNKFRKNRKRPRKLLDSISVIFFYFLFTIILLITIVSPLFW